LQIPAHHPEHWQDYELLDCGNFEKLERFGQIVLIRPEPQALWQPVWSAEEWQKMAHGRFEQQGSNAGSWVALRKGLPEHWYLKYNSEQLKLKFRLALTGFKHVGIFPEQADNWEYIAQQVKRLGQGARVLNLFAYTGGASLAAKQAGADVIHLDSVKQVVSWSRSNMELSGLTDIRWLVEDARKFVQREVKRGRTYQGIMLDPPAYGLGPNGERWKLEEQLGPMMEDVFRLLDPEGHFLVLNAYSLGLSSLIVDNFLAQHYGLEQRESGELFLQARSGMKLPLGVFGRASL
jgi:23S rRNA (cytosine1962-C5)-methyltransferase